MKIFGLPVQFVVVVAISAALTIFFGAWAADARVEARALDFSATSTAQYSSPDSRSAFSFPEHPVSGELGNSQTALEGESQKEFWESAFLFTCPLH